jgi:undecaprenyl-diphosphatase
MTEIQALILGILQGLTEFLPVSSSGHLEIGHALFDIHGTDNLYFDLLLHVATVLSTIAVFRKDILQLIKGLLAFKWNEETIFVSKLLLSSIPVLFIGLFFREQVEQMFTGNLFFVGCMLIITAALLGFTHFAKKGNGEITFGKSLIIGIAQAIAVTPGISRSGATIATGLLLKTKKENVARFSFLMVLIPILGAAFLDLLGNDSNGAESIGTLPLMIGFVAAFITGLLACSWMIRIVKKGNLIYFSIYCLVIGVIAIFAA